MHDERARAPPLPTVDKAARWAQFHHSTPAFAALQLIVDSQAENLICIMSAANPMIILTPRPAQDEPRCLPDAAAISAITPFSFAEIAEVISETHAERDDIAIDLMRDRSSTLQRFLWFA